MMRYQSLLAIAPLLFAVLACQTIFPTPEPAEIPAPTQTVQPTQVQIGDAPQTEDDVPRIGVKEAKAAYDSGAAVFVDTRSARYYGEGHIPGALSIPLDTFEYEFASVSLQREQWIITYCT